jgi:hypothetical protein
VEPLRIQCSTSANDPLADRPLIDWDLILVMEPLTIAGALIGAFLNKLLPELFLTVLLVILLSLTAQTSLKQAMKMYAKETIAIRAKSGIRADGTKESELSRIAAKEEQSNPVASETGGSLLDSTEENEEGVTETGNISLDLGTILEEERVTPKLNWWFWLSCS